MKRSMFGDPRPLGADEITEALADLGLDPSEVEAQIDEPGEDGFGGHGWTAEVSGWIDGDDDRKEFSTLAYPTKAQLLRDLAAAGIDKIDE